MAICVKDMNFKNSDQPGKLKCSLVYTVLLFQILLCYCYSYYSFVQIHLSS